MKCLNIFASLHSRASHSKSSTPGFLNILPCVTLIIHCNVFPQCYGKLCKKFYSNFFPFSLDSIKDDSPLVGADLQGIPSNENFSYNLGLPTNPDSRYEIARIDSILQ